MSQSSSPLHRSALYRIRTQRHLLSSVGGENWCGWQRRLAAIFALSSLLPFISPSLRLFFFLSFERRTRRTPAANQPVRKGKRSAGRTRKKSGSLCFCVTSSRATADVTSAFFCVDAPRCRHFRRDVFSSYAGVFLHFFSFFASFASETCPLLP